MKGANINLYRTMFSRISKAVVIAVFIAMLVPFAAFANETASSGERSGGELRYNWKMDVAVTALATSGWIITMAAMNKLSPARCRWCQVDSFDRWGHDNIKWSSTGAAQKAVHVTGYALAPLAAFGLSALVANHDGRLSNFVVDALVIAEATSLSLFTNQMVKIAAGRQRPRAHFSSVPVDPHDDNDSFYSGHTALTFTLAVASGTVASMRGYSLAPWIWGAGLTIAATTGYLSLASDRHYLTDVITGAAVGSAFGFAIPYLFHRPRRSNSKLSLVTVQPVDGGGLLMVGGAW